MSPTSHEQVYQLFLSKVTQPDLLYDFKLYDSSVNQKLWAVQYYCNQLCSQDVNDFRVFAAPSETLSSGIAMTLHKVVDPVLYLRHLNLALDGFFMNSMSLFDTLAHELYTLYRCGTQRKDIYISTAQKMLSNCYPASNVKTLLSQQLKDGSWFTEFEPFRHCTTHESLIHHDDIQINIDPDPPYRHSLLRPIRLPDDPLSRPFTYLKNRIATEYCSSTLKNIETFVDSLYDAILMDIHANGDSLPITPPPTP